jgi:hypothetical protein
VCPRAVNSNRTTRGVRCYMYLRAVPERRNCKAPSFAARATKPTPLVQRFRGLGIVYITRQIYAVIVAAIAEANAFAQTFITDYNARFAKAPSNWVNAHRPTRPLSDVQLLPKR